MARISSCMLEKSGVQVDDLDEVDEDDEVDETVEEGRGGTAPRLIVKIG